MSSHETILVKGPDRTVAQALEPARGLADFPPDLGPSFDKALAVGKTPSEPSRPPDST